MSRFRNMLRKRSHTETRDEGSALILALVLILVGTMMVIPVMRYTMAITRANRVTSSKAASVEAVKAGLRVALYDPAALYQACANDTGPSVGKTLGTPPGLDIVTKCYSMKLQSQNLPTQLRYGLTVVQVGAEAAIPPPYGAQPGDDPLLDQTISADWCTSMVPTPQKPVKVPCGRAYPGNGNPTGTHAWITDTRQTIETNTIWAPFLPPYARSLPRSSSYLVQGDQPCQVFFPGRYPDDVTIKDSTPVYFVSGVYYFEKALRITGNANIVVGAGAAQGCVDSDAVAVADAVGAPYDASSSGVGGTFVFGANGRLVIDNAVATAGTGMSLSFNRRLVDKSDDLAKLNDISIMSVNGFLDPVTTNIVDLDIPGQIYVPKSTVVATETEPKAHGYIASTLVSGVTAPVPCAPPPTAPAASCPIIDLNFTTAAKVTLDIAGYVVVPQGSVSINTTPAGVANKTVAFGGGILAGQVAVSASKPASLQIGLLNPVVQRTFKITTTTKAGVKPYVESTALVQVNQTGGYAVNSWVVQSS